MGNSQLRFPGTPQRDTVQTNESCSEVQELSEQNHADMPLKFDGILVIVGGGAVDEAVLRTLVEDGASVIAADGGADGCARAGIVPEAILGDMDSLENQDDWVTKTRIIEINEQLTTDFEKCLYSSDAPVTIALGMTGKRFDHTLAALDCVTRFARKRHIILVDEKDIALAVSGEFTFPIEVGDRVSVHPLGKVSFARSTGLEYPLDGLTLEQGVRTGTSNMATNSIVSIEPQPGEEMAWLLLVDRKYLKNLTSHLLMSA